MIVTSLTTALSAALVVFLVSYYFKKKEYDTRVQEIEQEIKEKNTELEKVKDTLVAVEIKTALLDELEQKISQTEEQLTTLSHKRNEIEKNFEIYNLELQEDYEELLCDYNDRIAAEQEKIKALRQIQTAYLEEQKRKEQMELDKDYYRLVLPQPDIEDIEELRRIQFHMSRKDVVDKIIWSAYYKPSFDILSSHLFANSASKVCGIYKITSIESSKVYIGQSVDIQKRFSDHIKSALSFSPASNKLYQEMKKQGPYNFTFEILEEVPKPQLDAREKYWIDFYQSKEYGFNSTAGNN